MSQLLRPARIVLLLALVVPLAALAEQSAEDYLNRGITQYQRGESDAAIASFRKAIDLQPDLAAAHFALGEALLLKGQVDDAVQEVFLDCFRHGGVLAKAAARPLESFQAFLRGAVRKVALRTERRRARQSARRAPYGPDRLPSDDD